MNKVPRTAGRLLMLAAGALLAAQASVARENVLPKRPLNPTITARASGEAITRLWVRQTDFRLHGEVGFFIHQVLLRLKPKNAGVLLLDDPTAMLAEVVGGSIFVTDRTLELLLNEDLARVQAPIRNLRLSTTRQSQWVEGELLRKGRWRPLKLRCQLQLTGPLQVALLPQQVWVDGVEATAALTAASLELSEVLSLNSAHMQLVGSRILIDLNDLFPPPHLEFAVRQLSLGQGGLDLQVGDELLDWPKLNNPPDSYLFVEGGDLKLARTLLVSSYALFTAQDRRQPLQFSLYDYRSQLQNAAVRLREDGALQVALAPLIAPVKQEAGL